MKSIFWICMIVLIGDLLLLCNGCKKDSNNTQIPVLTTAIVNNIKTSTATSGGNITSDGGSAIIVRGICWSTGDNPTINDRKTTDSMGTGWFASKLTGLSQNTTYYARAYATNSAGTGYGNIVTFTTQQEQVPVLTTNILNDILQTTAICGGNIIADGGSAIITRGVCWSTGLLPTLNDNKTTDGSGTGNFETILKNLMPKTTYYVRAYASNRIGTGYGSILSFTTQKEIGTITDIDNNVYHTITIGTQVWLVENLKTTKYNDGKAIALITDNTKWSNLSTAGYCWYNNNETIYKNLYGTIFNWYAVNSGNLCPAGWHVPSDSEWMVLSGYLGPKTAGEKIKESGTTHWNSPNANATNETGFTALPGGSRNNTGVFNYQGFVGYWWTSTERDSTKAWSRYLSTYGSEIYSIGGPKESGYSVRCLRD